MKVFLVQAPLWGLSPPIGIAQLGAYLAQAGHEVEAFDMNVDLYRRRGESYRYAWEAGFSSAWTQPDWVAKFFEANREFVTSQYLRRISAVGEAAVGFSVNCCSMESSLYLARRIKDASPGTRVAFGGQHFTVRRDEAVTAVKSGAVDAVIFSDGEYSFAELLQCWKEGRDVEGCSGLCYPDKGLARFTPARRPVELDALPFADYRLFDLEAYENYDSNLILFMASRGCVRSCLFCGYRTPWAGYRTMSGDRIFAEIKHQERIIPNVRGLYFYDLLINGDMRALERLCDRILGDDSVYRHPWEYCNCIIRPEMSEALCRKMKSAGCNHVQIGIESGSQHVLDLMKKEQSIVTTEAVLQNLARAGIVVKGNFMFGFPGETERDFEGTLEFLKRVHPYLPKVYPSYTFTLMEPASPIGIQREKYGVLSRGDGSDIFWESQDGRNTYPVRLERYRRFCDLAESLGVEVEYGYQVPIDAFQSYWLAQYYEYKGDDRHSLKQYERYLRYDPENQEVRRKRDACAVSLAARGVSAESLQSENEEPLRILCLGDAFTAGGGVAGGDAYPKRLKQLLYERYGRLAREILVINAADPQCNSSMAARDFERNLEAHRPDMVLLWIGHNNNSNFTASNYPLFFNRPPSFLSRLSDALFNRNIGSAVGPPSRESDRISQVLRRVARLNAEKNFPESIQYLEELLARGSKNDGRLRHALGYLYLNFMNKPSLALPHLEMAFHFDPTNEEVAYHLFTAYYRMGKLRRARRLARRLHQIRPGDDAYRRFAEHGVPDYRDFPLYRRVFRHDVEAIAERCRRKEISLFLQTYPEPHWLNEAIVTAAAELRLPLIDHRHVFGEHSSGYYENLLPNAEGCLLLAKNVLMSIEPLFSRKLREEALL